MNLQPIIDALAPLKVAATLREVEGAAALAAIATGPIPAPCVYVIPAGEKAGENELVGAVNQRIAARFAIVYAVTNQYDSRGKVAGDDLHTIQAAVRGAIVGLTPTGYIDKCLMVEGDFIDFDDQVLLWQDIFETAYYERRT